MELIQSALALPAVEPEWFRQVVADPSLLAEIAHAVDGPFHVLHPQAFAQNLREFQDALVSAGLRGQVYFGKKANKAASWLRVCADLGSGVDVASVPELAHALSHGVRGSDIGVTGAAKSDELLWLASRHHCLIAVDALDELDRVLALPDSGEPARILLRVLPEVNPDSRFGLSPAELDQALARCVQERSKVSMEGFSFHLNGYEVLPRARLADELVDRLLRAREQGLAATSLSIGGGFAVSYLEAQTWAKFLEQRRESDFHSGKAFSHFYPYHQSTTGADMLSAILAVSSEDGRGTVGEKLARADVRLLLEPGRALLVGAGFTVFPVQGYKQRDGYGITTVNGLSMSLSEQWKSSEFLPDPTLWPLHSDGAPETAAPTRSCVGGASCMEYDMLTWRKVWFSRAPRYGDLLIYPNTAGYQMDKNESEFHQLPLPPKVVVAFDDGRIQWRLDEKGHRG